MSEYGNPQRNALLLSYGPPCLAVAHLLQGAAIEDRPQNAGLMSMSIRPGRGTVLVTPRLRPDVEAGGKMLGVSDEGKRAASYADVLFCLFFVDGLMDVLQVEEGGGAESGGTKGITRFPGLQESLFFSPILALSLFGVTPGCKAEDPFVGPPFNSMSSAGVCHLEV